MEQLSIFDDIEAAENAKRDRERELLKTPTSCLFCNERISNASWGATNHGIVFNGWCVKALMYHTRCQGMHTSEAKWLTHVGIDPLKDRWDESHWHLENVKNHYQGHYGSCYDVECRELS